MQMVRLHRLQRQGPYREPPEVENPYNKIVEHLHRQEKQSHLQILRQRDNQLHPQVQREERQTHREAVVLSATTPRRREMEVEASRQHRELPLVGDPYNRIAEHLDRQE